MSNYLSWKEFTAWVRKNSSRLNVDTTRCDVDDNVWESRYVEIDIVSNEISYVFTETGDIFLIKGWNETIKIAEDRDYFRMRDFLLSILED